MAAIAPPLAIILVLTLVFYLAKWSAYRRKS
jgi:cbb3-type cytochrome oxidase subunit 3